MKINQSKHEPQQQQNLDITALYNTLKKEHRNVFIEQIDGQVFFLRSLNRSEFKRLIEDERFNDMEKEEIICQSCTLWPEGYDFEDCDAGTPTKLSKIIMKNSYFDSIESRKIITTYYRQEMFDLDNQINCIINEAFPHIDIEEIEEWDLEKTAKYLSRAEWKLANLRGMNINFDPLENSNQEPVGPVDPQARHTQKVTTEEIEESPIKQGKIETLAERQARLAKQGKEVMTPEKLAELKTKYPEINWESDAVIQNGMDGLKDSVDVTSPALRTGW